MINANTTVGVVILAAGFSTRMGAFKPLLPFGRGTVLSTIAKAWAEAGARTRLVVSGYEAERTEAEALRCGCSVIRNFSPQDGMFSSVLCGLEALASHQNPEWLAVHPVDIPLVRPSTLEACMRFAAASSARAFIPSHAGRGGHPPFIHRSAVPDVLAWKGEHGLRGALNALCPTYLATEDPFVRRDMDTPEAYRSLLVDLLSRDAGRETPEQCGNQSKQLPLLKRP